MLISGVISRKGICFIVRCVSSILRRFSSEDILRDKKEDAPQETKMNVLDTIYKDDKSLLVEGCDCYACKRFTKGYVHHLFNCHEMLGVILLYDWKTC